MPNAADAAHGPARVLLVVATLGRRPALLERTLKSIRAQSVPADLVIVAPLEAPGIRDTAARYGAVLLPDPGSLPGAINAGAATARPHHEYLNWLNDDDELEEGSLAATTRALDGDCRAVVAFGACRYVDEQGRQLWLSRAGRWGPRLLAWGPDLIPQPGMLIRTTAWNEVGGLDESYRLAFDLDLLLRLKRLGRLIDTQTVVSSFRWHADSLTVDDRTTNLMESERAKRAALPRAVRPLAPLWERPMRVAIRLAAAQVSRRARSLPSP